MTKTHWALGLTAVCLTLGVSAGTALGHDYTPPPNVPAALVVPGAYEVKAAFSASGVQIYRCLPAVTAPAINVWTFIAPEATLFSSRGKVAGHHFAGPTWQAVDGSKVLGTVIARAASPLPGTIPWLLLSALVTQRGETFEGVVYVQRVNTQGGAAPTTGCGPDSIDTEVRVPYTADYFFYSND